MSTHKKTMIAGNWKMHLTVAQASLLVQRLHERVQTHKDIEVVLAPTMLQLQPLSVQLDRRKFRLAAQNAYYKDEGAYTGEVSFTMLRNLVTYALIGHSERRHIFNESLDEVTQKVAAAYRNGIVPILCVGETKIEKLSKETNQVLHDQVVSALANVTSEEVKNIVQKEYYHFSEKDQKEIEDGMIQSIVNSLGDKHSSYFTPKEAKDFSEVLR